MVYVDAIVLTGLKDEADAFAEIVGEAGSVRLDDDHGRPHYRVAWHGCSIVVAWAAHMGGQPTLQRLSDLTKHFETSVLAMCGICAGHRQRVNLGDVIVADRVYDYESGKRTRHGFEPDTMTFALRGAWKMRAELLTPRAPSWTGRLHDRPRSRLEWCEQFLIDLAVGRMPDRESLAINSAVWAGVWSTLHCHGYVDGHEVGEPALTDAGWKRVRVIHFNGPTEPEPIRAHIGPLASGSAVMADGHVFERLSTHQRKVLGVDMEAAALGRFADESRRAFIVVKGVADYADGEKDNVFHPFAMRASASFLAAFLEMLAPSLAMAGATEPGRVPTKGEVARVDVIAVVRAAIRRNLDRGLLLGCLPDDVRGRLPDKSSPYEQYMSDITELSRAGKLEDGRWILAIWLEQAEHLAGPFGESTVFRTALTRLTAPATEA